MSELRHRLQGTNLYLVGMMGAGKSTIGKLVSQKLGYRFFDTDSVIEQATGQSISQIFASSESEFRQLETEVLSELAAYSRLVVATGGGIVSRPQNWSYLRHGLVIWLNVPLEILQQRLKNDRSRPLLRTSDPWTKLQLLLQERRSFYAQADLEILVGDESAEQVAQRLLANIPTVLKPAQTQPESQSENQTENQPDQAVPLADP